MNDMRGEGHNQILQNHCAKLAKQHSDVQSSYLLPKQVIIEKRKVAIQL